MIGHGDDFLIKLSNGDAPETFDTIAGLMTTAMSINNSAIDVTNKDNPYWTQLEPGGIKSLALQGTGVMKDAASMKKLMAAIVSTNGDDMIRCKLVSGLGYAFIGTFFLASLDPSGDVGKEEKYSIKLQSARDIQFVPIPDPL